MLYQWFRNLQEAAVGPHVSADRASEKVLQCRLHTFLMKSYWFLNIQEAAAKPLWMVRDLQQAAVKPFTHVANGD